METDLSLVWRDIDTEVSRISRGIHPNRTAQRTFPFPFLCFWQAPSLPLILGRLTRSFVVLVMRGRLDVGCILWSKVCMYEFIDGASAASVSLQCSATTLGVVVADVANTAGVIGDIPASGSCNMPASGERSH